eukprot:CAMPEP_0198244916 /NCGR_PEP_ID=MMETSP1446-20131203/38235_1 /TAXON_ID=1461542 ORGANISM="Unidentified sp, Strain CCMP2111" /NCGR_SAMPLE_ID=MMETSP1446 /ASSEMBLY_ACC=CAM_ASM_001112 /LENGTH=172 /DNA_ID=CAMNT_0043929031 /DNA_START=49 /DNA_END=564 /DNA_ORIENTATION=-
MKHLFAYMAPYYFVYMLRRYCVGPKAMQRFCMLGGVVISVFALSMGPFVYLGQIGQVMGRLFPFGRGLCHAYWAPNFWALYSLADKVLVKASRILGLGIGANVDAGHLAGGIVGVANFAILPQVSPTATVICVLLSMMPCLVRAWSNPKPKNILRDIAYVNLCGYMFGYHVH